MNRHLHAVPPITAPVAEDLAAQDEALNRQCPLCAVPRDEYCVNPLTGKHLHGNVSHWQRIKSAHEPTREPQDD
jgi:hypothetical protein